MSESEIKLGKIKCTRCSKKTQISFMESSFKNGIVISYCYNPVHREIKLRVVTKKNVPRLIRNDRIKSNSSSEESFNMKKMKCPLCGRLLHFDKKGSYQSGGIVSGYCFNNNKHRLKIEIYAKLVKEPTCEEFQEVFISISDY